MVPVGSAPEASAPRLNTYPNDARKQQQPEDESRFAHRPRGVVVSKGRLVKRGRDRSPHRVEGVFADEKASGVARRPGSEGDHKEDRESDPVKTGTSHMARVLVIARAKKCTNKADVSCYDILSRRLPKAGGEHA